MPNPELINGTDLHQWSDTLEARSLLPRLIRRLLLANKHVREVEMRSGEGVGVPGYDGTVTGIAGDKHVPEGFSGWELGTSGDPGGKAQDDYRDRTRDVAEDERLATTFVAVTSRRWSTREDWRKRKLTEGKWHDVRAYDADSLEAWMEITPSVHVWTSEVLGREPRYVRTPDLYLPGWSRQTQPAMTGSFLLAGRQEAASSLVEMLRQPAQVTMVIAPSADEAVVFICASLLSDEELNRAEIARALVVDDPTTWARLVDAESPLILIPTFANADASSAIANGHHVVVTLSRQVGTESSVIAVSELDVRIASDVLVADGIDRREAESIATAARRSLQAVRRTYAVNPNWQTPAWATQPEAARLAPLCLLGQWDVAHDGDREVVAALCRASYEELEPELLAWSTLEDPPIRRTGSAWRVTSRRDGWDLLHPFITPTTLATFRERAVEVLSNRREAPTTITAMLVPDHFSRPLREGMADTCAFLAGEASGYVFADSSTGASCAAQVVQSVLSALGSEDGPTWASLEDVLPLLAEAAPDVFLEHVESDLLNDEPQLGSIFPDEDAFAGLFAGRSPYVGVVWALEALCWSSDFLGRAARALARLDGIDPGGRNGPRPFGALHGALNLFHPQTSVPLDRRLAVLDGLRESVPDQAWKLLKALLPTVHGLYTDSYRPRWRRGWVRPAQSQPTFADVVAGVPLLVDRLIADAGSDFGRWAEVVPLIEHLPADERNRVITELEGVAPRTEVDG